MNEPSEMPTPRTDAQTKVYRYRADGSGLIYNHPEAAGDCTALVYVSESFAKQLERDLSNLRLAAEAARVALDEIAKPIYTSNGDGTESDNVPSYKLRSIAKAALASLRSELAKTTPATPETPVPRPG